MDTVLWGATLAARLAGGRRFFPPFFPRARCPPAAPPPRRGARPSRRREGARQKEEARQMKEEARANVTAFEDESRENQEISRRPPERPGRARGRCRVGRGAWRPRRRGHRVPLREDGSVLRLYAGRPQGQAGRAGRGVRVRAGRTEPAPAPNGAQDPIEPAPAAGGEPHRPRPSLPSRSNFFSSATELFRPRDFLLIFFFATFNFFLSVPPRRGRARRWRCAGAAAP